MLVCFACFLLVLCSEVIILAEYHRVMRSCSPCRQVPPIPGDVTAQLRSLPWDVPWVSWFRQRVHQKPCVHFSFCFWLRVGSSGLTHESLPAGHFRLRSFALRGGRSSLTWVPRRPFGVERPENCPHSGEDGGVERFTGVVSLKRAPEAPRKGGAGSSGVCSRPRSPRRSQRTRT